MYIVTHSSDERLKYDLDFENKLIIIKYSRSHIDREDDRLYKEYVKRGGGDRFNKYEEKLEDLKKFELKISFEELENLTSLIKK